MKFLLIEDDSNKSKHITVFLEEEYPKAKIFLRRSYQSGLKEIFTNDFDMIFLDMQLPTFDIKSGEDGYKFRKLAGVDILNEIKRKKKKAKIIIITQFETFGEGSFYVELEDLKNSLISEFGGIYIDTVYYNAGQTSWKNNLSGLINSNISLND